MSESAYVVQLESLFMALADKTRLRLLSLMVDGEVNVGDLAETLGESQPKISRHLAYLRNSGLVNTSRDGKWIHYSICWPEDDGMLRILHRTLEAIRETSALPADRYLPERRDTENILHISAHPDILQDRQEAHNELEEFLL